MQNNTDILIYQTKDGNTKIDVKLEDETVRDGENYKTNHSISSWNTILAVGDCTIK